MISEGQKSKNFLLGGGMPLDPPFQILDPPLWTHSGYIVSRWEQSCEKMVKNLLAVYEDCIMQRGGASLTEYKDQY